MMFLLLKSSLSLRRDKFDNLPTVLSTQVRSDEDRSQVGAESHGRTDETDLPHPSHGKRRGKTTSRCSQVSGRDGSRWPGGASAAVTRNHRDHFRGQVGARQRIPKIDLV